MSQYEIIQYLKAHPNIRFDYISLSDAIHANSITIRKQLKKLREGNFVNFATTKVGPTNVKKYVYWQKDEDIIN